MKASIPLVFLIFLGAFACAHSQPTEEELRAGEAPIPQLGVVGAVDEGTLAVRVAGSQQPQIFQRTTQTQVICAGIEVGWEALTPGEAVRVRWTEDVSGPSLAVTVEQLRGPEGEAVVRDVEGRASCDCEAGQPP